MPIAIAPIIEPTIFSGTFYEQNQLLNNNKFQKFMLYGRFPERFSHYFGP
jgi:hypothetical protein